MERPKLEVADVFRRYGEAYRENHAASLATGRRRSAAIWNSVMSAAISGTHSTPAGTGTAQSASQWRGPNGWRTGAYQNKKVVYDTLFRATAETLSTIAADPKHLGAGIGFFAVLHTIVDTPGAKPVPPSAPALRRARRRNRPRRHKMDWLPARLLPAGSCPVATVPAAVSQVSAKSI